MNPLERLWKDKMDIYRWDDYIENGVTKNREDLLYEDIKCQYSKGSLSDIGADGVPTLINSYTLFCSAETDLKEGDSVVVTQPNGRQIKLVVGEIFPYANHQEASVKRNDKA